MSYGVTLAKWDASDIVQADTSDRNHMASMICRQMGVTLPVTSYDAIWPDGNHIASDIICYGQMGIMLPVTSYDAIWPDGNHFASDIR